MLSICITLKNRSLVREGKHQLRLFPRCVESIVRAAQQVPDMEVVVTDWNSDDWPLSDWFDAAIGSVRHQVITVDGSFNRGQGRNQAADNARGTGLFFLDADCTLDASVLDAARRCLETGSAYFPIVYSYNGPDHATGWWRETGYGNCALSREVFQKTGGWPEYERWGKEDDDFYARVSSQVPVVRENTPGLTHQWHPDTVLWKDRFTAHYPWMLEEIRRRDVALAELADLSAPGTPFILVDEARFGNDPLPGRRILPFTEANGCYGGPPASDEAAISELERLRARGARFIAFAWMSDWWLDYYRGFRQHLESNYRRSLTTPELVVFDLNQQPTATP